MKDLRNETWVLVADGEKALFLVNDGDEEYPVLTVRRKEEHENPPTHEQGANRPGRFSDGPERAGIAGAEGHAQRSTVEPTDWHELEKERFADEIADILYKRAHEGAFKRIVLVAPPRVLGELRNKMHQEVAQRVVGEVDKTLTNHPIDKIQEILKAEIDHAA
ncbi:baeRF12 domain-containing protein [Roseitranquillus sediminis]|uniref:baeRF12 domain-containing protein n=1 Tax=Roseitranquillus sediminis TaxID=2809051 RepID=UPI001D0C28F3|nr:host attachment family protein [Roseitranquillus sediminis]MBM9594328.1 host attachment protein [Roseitranquillus sediminis]